MDDEPIRLYKVYKPSSKVGLEQMLKVYGRHKEVIRSTPILAPYLSDTVGRIVSLIQKLTGHVTGTISAEVRGEIVSQLCTTPRYFSSRQYRHILMSLREELTLGVGYHKHIAEGACVGAWNNIRESVSLPLLQDGSEIRRGMGSEHIHILQRIILVELSDNLAAHFNVEMSWHVLIVLERTDLWFNHMLSFTPAVIDSVHDEQERAKLFTALTAGGPLLWSPTLLLIDTIVRTIAMEVRSRYANQSS